MPRELEVAAERRSAGSGGMCEVGPMPLGEVLRGGMPFGAAVGEVSSVMW